MRVNGCTCAGLSVLNLKDGVKPVAHTTAVTPAMARAMDAGSSTSNCTNSAPPEARPRPCSARVRCLARGKDAYGGSTVNLCGRQSERVWLRSRGSDDREARRMRRSSTLDAVVKSVAADGV